MPRVCIITMTTGYALIVSLHLVAVIFDTTEGLLSQTIRPVTAWRISGLQRQAVVTKSQKSEDVLAASLRSDHKLDPQVLAINAQFERKPYARVLGATYFAMTWCAILFDGLPAFVRLLLIQYLAFSTFEYCFHRWFMHAEVGTWRDRVFARWNHLHLAHHLDTRHDMTMQEGYNWKGIRFNYLTSQLSVIIGSLISMAVCALLRLDLPLWPTPIAAATMSLYHGILWNRLHVDSHSLERSVTWNDGLPYVESIPTGNRYARWLLTNHIGHHAVYGKGNYNIVFPGPDHLADTFFRLKRDH